VDPVAILKGALPPIAAALLLVSLWGGRALPLAMGIGIYVAFGLLKDWVELPHELWADPNGTSWLVWGMVALGLVALLEHLRLLPRRLAPSVGFAAAAAVLWLMLDKLAQRWDGGEVALHVGVGGLVVALTTLAARGTLARAPKALPVAALWTLLLSLDAGLVTLGKSALLGQLCGAVAAAVGAAIGTSLWRRGFALQAADGVWLGGAHALFVLAGVQLGYLGWWPAICALAAPLPLWLLRGVAAERPWRWLLVSAPAPLALMGLAMWLAAPEPNPYGY
jgi:hypothetical protein